MKFPIYRQRGDCAPSVKDDLFRLYKDNTTAYDQLSQRSTI